jgi:hypothetical protein
MDIEIRGSIVDGEHDLVLARPWHPPWVLGCLSEHDLRDLEFALAQRRAVSRRCTHTWGEHTCSMAPGHGGEPGHMCRACTEIQPGTGS